MVNDRFPEPARYGFESVDAWKRRFGSDATRQSKIYAESNRTHFSRIFAALISMQTPAIYRRLLVMERLRGIKRKGIKIDG
jgi:hypothetical protein